MQNVDRMWLNFNQRPIFVFFYPLKRDKDWSLMVLSTSPVNPATWNRITKSSGLATVILIHTLLEGKQVSFVSAILFFGVLVLLFLTL